MKRPRWQVRAARREDRARLAAFVCADPDVSWEREVERFIQRTLFDWAFDPFAEQNDPRLLLLFRGHGGELVGVAAHERTELRYGRRRPFPATKLEVVALARTWQGRRFESGERAIDVLLAAVMTDVAARIPPRAARVFAIVHEKNARSLAVLARHGLVEELSRVNPSYRRLVTPSRGLGA